MATELRNVKLYFGVENDKGAERLGEMELEDVDCTDAELVRHYNKFIRNFMQQLPKETIVLSVETLSA